MTDDEHDRSETQTAADTLRAQLNVEMVFADLDEDEERQEITTLDADLDDTDWTPE